MFEVVFSQIRSDTERQLLQCRFTMHSDLRDRFRMLSMERFPWRQLLWLFRLNSESSGIVRFSSLPRVETVHRTWLFDSAATPIRVSQEKITRTHQQVRQIQEDDKTRNTHWESRRTEQTHHQRHQKSWVRDLRRGCVQEIWNLLDTFCLVCGCGSDAFSRKRWEEERIQIESCIWDPIRWCTSTSSI